MKFRPSREPPLLLAWTLRQLLRMFHELDTQEINHTHLDYPEHEITDGNAPREWRSDRDNVEAVQTGLPFIVSKMSASEFHGTKAWRKARWQKKLTLIWKTQLQAQEKLSSWGHTAWFTKVQCTRSKRWKKCMLQGAIIRDITPGTDSLL